MKLGILSDIHQHTVNLQAAIDVLVQQTVEQFVLLGDIVDTGRLLDETIDLLRPLQAIGVWGNHELGLCDVPHPACTARYSESVLQFFSSLQPRIELENVLFSHGLPTWDLSDPAAYYLGDEPWKQGSLTDVFRQFPQRVFFVGHFHRWLLSTDDQLTNWDGQQSIVLSSESRHFVVIHAVTDGWCATFDTETSELIPYKIA